MLALGCGTRRDCDPAALRYDRVVIMTDADVDGAHIATLLMTFFFTQMRPMIDKGHLYLACPPLYRLTQGAHRLYVADDAEKDRMMAKGLGGRGKIDVQRFKGLGEMDADQLAETTMDRSRRTLRRVTISDSERASEIFELLMGNDVAPRRELIQTSQVDRERIDA